MQISTYWPWTMPESLTGITLVVDVFGVTTNIISFIARGARLFTVNPQTVAIGLRKYPDALVAGEGYIAAGVSFDIPNAPVAVEEANVKGKTLLYTSINGTKAIDKALEVCSGEVVAAAFTNLSAVSAYLKNRNLRKVSLILSGDGGIRVAEDEEFGNTLVASVNGRGYDWDAAVKHIATFMSSYYPLSPSDNNYRIILQRDRYNCVPVCRKDSDRLVAVTDAA